MDVVRATTLGMCFGVRDALAALDAVADPHSATIRGELVHNPVVLHDLAVRGFQSEREADREGLPTTPTVVITAHGVSDRERRRLADAGKVIVDTTCPLVRRAHRAALALSKRAGHVVVIGRPGHVEVVGLTEDLPSVTVVPDVESVATYPHDSLGVLCQTTTPPAVATAIHARIVEMNPHAAVEFVNTVCAPTRNHQQALVELFAEVDAVVVVGGATSNNTAALVTMARKAGKWAVRVAGPEELDPAWFAGRNRVGLTAGTSTLPATVDAVEDWLRAR